MCRPCVAYRPDGRKPVMHVNGTDLMPIALRESEYLRMDDDPEAFFAQLDLPAVSYMARWPLGADELDNTVAEYRRETSRRWRAAHPGADKRKRRRDRAAYMREYRKRTVTPSGDGPPFRSSDSRALLSGNIGQGES